MLRTDPSILSIVRTDLFCGFENALIEGNVIGLADEHLIHHVRGRNVNAFNNRTPSGDTLPIYEDFGGGSGPFERQDSLEDKINDALCLSLL